MPIVSGAVALYRPEDRMMQLAVTGKVEKDSAHLVPAVCMKISKRNLLDKIAQWLTVSMFH